MEKFIIIILPNVGGGKECLYYFRNSDHLLHLEPSLLVKPKIHFHFGAHCFQRSKQYMFSLGSHPLYLVLNPSHPVFQKLEKRNSERYSSKESDENLV